MMTDDKLKNCPRCNAQHVCVPDNIETCQCNISLQTETREFLQETYFDCLCNDCLMYFDALIVEIKSESFPTKPSMLKEDIHYYLEGGKWVFTERYHALRGHCCGSGCRHCVFGYDNKS